MVFLFNSVNQVLATCQPDEKCGNDTLANSTLSLWMFSNSTVLNNTVSENNTVSFNQFSNATSISNSTLLLDQFPNATLALNQFSNSTNVEENDSSTIMYDQLGLNDTTITDANDTNATDDENDTNDTLPDPMYSF